MKNNGEEEEEGIAWIFVAWTGSEERREGAQV